MDILQQFLIVFLVTMLSGCGFKPILERASKPTPVTLSVNGIEGYLNYKFYQELQQQLNLLTYSHPLTIKVTLAQTIYDISYGRDATALRSQNVITAFYEIWKDGKLIHKGKTDAISSYNVDRNDEFSSLTSRLSSDEKTIQAMAIEVAREVFLKMHQ